MALIQAADREDIDIRVKAGMSFSRNYDPVTEDNPRTYCEQFHVGIANICILFTETFLKSYAVL